MVCTETSCGAPVGRRPARSAFACISPSGTDCTQISAAPIATITPSAAARAFLESIRALFRVIRLPSRRFLLVTVQQAYPLITLS